MDQGRKEPQKTKRHRFYGEAKGEKERFLGGDGGMPLNLGQTQGNSKKTSAGSFKRGFRCDKRIVAWNQNNEMRNLVRLLKN